jgi:hypothetical protein
VNNKLLVALNNSVSQQAAATEDTMAAVHHLIDYCATYSYSKLIYMFRRSYPIGMLDTNEGGLGIK